MFHSALSFLLLLISFTVYSQPSTIERPKLVIGIMVDQMRNDYLQRYSSQFSEKGFKRLINGGFYARNHHFSYAPTYTGPGHASVYTGTTPAVHGIIGNDWYDPLSEHYVNCVEDTSVSTVGDDSGEGEKSPKWLMTTTLCDELRLSTNFRSKVIGVAMKDRGAILPVGHTPNAAYWFSGNGNFISSSYYMDELPQWVEDFNMSGRAKDYLQTWNPLLPLEDYLESLSEDDNPFEGRFKGENKSSFPHELLKLSRSNGNFEILKTSPYGNDLILDFAEETILHEKLGLEDRTDFLALSFSSTDYIGHRYGVRSIEVEDTYLRLDQRLGEFIDFLDKNVGEGNYLLFLTADHGAVENPDYGKQQRLPGGYVNYTRMGMDMSEYLNKKYNSDTRLIQNVSNSQVFLDYEKILEIGEDPEEVALQVANFIQQDPSVYAAYTKRDVMLSDPSEWPLQQLRRGLYPKRSGDVIVVSNSGWLEERPYGTSHGSSFQYDTHVPFILYGWKVKAGTGTYRETQIRDIAGTIALMLNISMPGGSTGKPILEVLEK